MRVAFLLGAVVALGGCDVADDRPATWSYLHTAVIAPNCATAGCHSTLAAQNNINLANPTEAYLALTGRRCGSDDTATDFVVPFQPDRSRLMYLLRGENTDIMPPDRPLAAPEIELVERWILEGALCD